MKRLTKAQIHTLRRRYEQLRDAADRANERFERLHAKAQTALQKVNDAEEAAHLERMRGGL